MASIRPLFAVAAACLAGAATAQNTFIYTFDLVVTANEVIVNGGGGQLATLPIGTFGELRIVLDADSAGYPGWDTDTINAFNIREISFTAGAMSVQGAPGVYPTSSPFLAMQLANDEWTSIPELIRSDTLLCILSWNHPEIAFSSFVLRQDSQPGQIPTLFTTLDLPTWVNLPFANIRKFVLDSAQNSAHSVTFTLIGIQGTPLSDCRGDVNGDGTITPSDFSAWIAAFNSSSPACDQNNDALCTASDFSAWIANYNAGCP